MAYTTERADALAQLLEKFSTAYAHHVAAQFANMEFWLDEVLHVLAVIDDYPRRFARLRDAQAAWVTAHGTMVSGYCRACRGKCEFDPQPPMPPIRIDHKEFDAARRQLRDGAYHFLLRCHRMGLMDASALKTACERVGTSVDVADLED